MTLVGAYAKPLPVDLDLILVGGGLASGLIALKLAKVRPELRVAIVEASDRIGGNHTWSSFDKDLRSAQRAWTARLYVKQWRAYSVAFPKFRRTLGLGYASATSERLDGEVRAVIRPERLFLGRTATLVAPDSVTLDDGTVLKAKAVVDARGPVESRHLDLRWQKFVGQHVELEAPHGLAYPVIMDATVAQDDGYRFVYLLPFGNRDLLIEDTYYADGAGLDVERLRTRIAEQAAKRGWKIARVIREEQGVLPIALGGDIRAFLDEGEKGVPRVGLRAGLFHPTTGYSFPDAVRVADRIAAIRNLTSANIAADLRQYAETAWKKRGFYRMLNRMLFLAAEPGQRYKVLERFYRLDTALISRFYAGNTTLLDKAFILIGKPPVPIKRALKVVKEQPRA